MRAVVLSATNEPLGLEDVEELPLQPTEVRVEVEACGVCHSDLTIWTGGIPVRTPSILGHEVCGAVVEVGAHVTHVGAGDRVLLSIVPSCGRCFYCTRGASHLCEAAGQSRSARRGARSDGTPVYALTGFGGFAERMAVPAASVVPVRTDLPPEQLALIGCGVTTGVGAVLNAAPLAPGDTVAVVGSGAVGLSVIQGARISGAARIVAIDTNPAKLAAATAAGATDVVVAPTEPGGAVEVVRELTAGRGVDCAFEAVGAPQTILDAYAMTRRAGRVVLLGMPKVTDEVTFPAVQLFLDEKRIIGCYYGGTVPSRDFPLLIDLVERGRLVLEDMVTATIGLDGVGDAFAAMQAGTVLRSVVRP